MHQLEAAAASSATSSNVSTLRRRQRPDAAPRPSAAPRPVKTRTDQSYYRRGGADDLARLVAGREVRAGGHDARRRWQWRQHLRRRWSGAAIAFARQQLLMCVRELGGMSGTQLAPPIQAADGGGGWRRRAETLASAAAGVRGSGSGGGSALQISQRTASCSRRVLRDVKPLQLLHTSSRSSRYAESERSLWSATEPACGTVQLGEWISPAVRAADPRARVRRKVKHWC